MSSAQEAPGNHPPQPGVSVVICCHNSASRLPETLRCLAAQKNTEDVPWEVIVVDNGSTDNTEAVARSSWPESGPAPLRIVNEPILSLSNARVRGLDSARYEYVSLVDDDNWVADDWVERLNHRMSSDSHIGACGGRITAEFEVPPPPWWRQHAGSYAVGDQWSEEGDVTHSKGWLYGAGLSVRRSAWEQLRERGFRFHTSDRRGGALAGGGDNELCYALRQAGWKLWLDWSLQLRHYIPANRMKWSYLRQLHRASGGTSVTLNAYLSPSTDRLRMHWLWQAMATIKQILVHPGDFWAYATHACEGAEEVLRTEARLGKLATLLRVRGTHARTWHEIQEGGWRKDKLPESPTAVRVH